MVSKYGNVTTIPFRIKYHSKIFYKAVLNYEILRCLTRWALTALKQPWTTSQHWIILNEYEVYLWSDNEFSRTCDF